ncbi:MAG: hypothetical protein ACRDHW_19100, partial [Ktedonobacteraceae bacterium]
RSVIKYNSTLSAEQKAEVLAEIEDALAFLEARLAANASIESGVALSPEKLVNLLANEATGEESLEALFPDGAPAQQELALKDLHKLYYAYLSNEPGKGMDALEARYRTVMGLLDQLGTGTSTSDERLLHRTRGFISAIYAMFKEFALLFSNVVEGKNIDMDTEALALLHRYSHEQTGQQVLRDITPLMHVYHRHLQLQEHKGTLTSCAREATAFFVFLEGCLGPNFSRRTELIGQLKSITNLLNELARLLAEYEQAMSEMSTL